MSSKLRKSTHEPDEGLAVDMSPMIDMVFLLLIFFIVNATAIIVQTDPDVKPPIATNSKMQKDREGRIVINVRNDGTFSAEDFKVELPDDQAIFEVITNERRRVELLGQVPQLHLRGDKDAVFKYSRRVIKAAAAAQVTQVVFAVYSTDKGLNPEDYPR